MKASYRFRPRLAPTLATLVLLPLLVQLGLWQWHKGQAKLALQQRIDSLSRVSPLVIGPYLISGNSLRDRRVVVRGRYESGYQILLDNQVHGEDPGFHVLTPLRIEGSEARVLVNRGWVPLGMSREDLPRIEPPGGLVEVTGTVWEPSRQKFVLSAHERAGTGWQTVWEAIDLDRYRAQVPYALQPFVVRLDSAAAGCYVCDWPRPDERVGMHLGYALQWFGMAAVLAAFYVFASLERVKGTVNE